jgi:hypothetical protein
MKNLSKILDREDKWYKIGPITIPRGVSKRTPFYFLAIEAILIGIGQIPFSPVWLINQIENGWCVTYLILPTVLTAVLQNLKTHGKTPESYALTMLSHWFRPKRVSPYQEIEEPTIYEFGTTYTIRLEERRKEEA